MYWVNAAETHETFHQESGMRYQFRRPAPILSVNRGFFAAACGAVPLFVPLTSGPRAATHRGAGPRHPATSLTPELRDDLRFGRGEILELVHDHVVIEVVRNLTRSHCSFDVPWRITDQCGTVVD